MLSTLMNVSIGLMLLYLVLSLICTTVNELVAGLLKFRAKDLAKTVEKLLDDDKLRSAFYSNGLIVSAALAARGGKVKKWVTPWIAPVPQDAVAGQGSPGAPGPGENNTTKTLTQPHPSYFPSETVARALIASLDPTKPLPGTDEITSLIEKLPEGSTIKSVLRTQWAVAEQNAERFRTGIADWFDGAMDRLSGEYNRKLKLLSLLVGFLIAAIFNADSINIARTIWTDAPLQEQIAHMSDTFLASEQLAACTSASGEVFNDAACHVTRFANLNDQLRPFALGWNWREMTKADVWWFFAKVFGLLWTGIALSLGAPFWFDLLQKFMNLRAAGPTPDSKKQAKQSDGSTTSSK